MYELKSSEQFMTTWDDTQLFYRAWVPVGQSPEKAVIIFHRGHEHSGRLLGLVETLKMQNFAFFAWDARGNGKSPGPRDYADNFSVYVKDANCFVNFISKKYDIPINNLAVIANSVGAVIATTWIHDYAPPIKALVLAAPAFRIKLYLPFAIPLLRLALKLGVMKNVTSYVKARVLTHDKSEQEAFNQDPAITNSIATNILLDVHDVSTRIINDAGAIRTPTLMHVAGTDWVVKTPAQKQFFDGLSSSIKEWKFYPGFYHAIFHEKDRAIPIEETRHFIEQIFLENPTLSPLLNADIEGFTKSEYDRLKKPRNSLFFAINRLLLKTVGRLSSGIQLGLAEGFDSGVTLDYVYRNQPQGISPLGRFIDRQYLGSIGWKGIRQRKINIEHLITRAVRTIAKNGSPIHIVDIAAGPGRYILDVIKSNRAIPITALLRDYKDTNLEQGRKIVEEMGLDNVQFEKGDAFNQEELSRLSPKPTLCIVSGLYELFPENEPVLNSLKGLAQALDNEGYLIYTNQPWHPQVEYIARVLPNREGEPWVMRRRTQEEMDDLVRAAGFEKLDMEIDQWGIFTVSLARKKKISD